MADVRVYFVIGTGTLPTPSEAQWISLVNQAKTKPLAAAILSAARAAQNFISASKRSQGVAALRKNTLCGFEVESNQVPAIQIVLDAQAAIRGVAGNNVAKFQGVLQGELQDSAIDLGYTVPQSAQLSVTVINTGSFARDLAIVAVQAYLVTNDAIWHGTLP